MRLFVDTHALFVTVRGADGYYHEHAIYRGLDGSFRRVLRVSEGAGRGCVVDITTGVSYAAVLRVLRGYTRERPVLAVAQELRYRYGVRVRTTWTSRAWRILQSIGSAAYTLYYIVRPFLVVKAAAPTPAVAE